jgi:photosystem II stability/assembly factor-like uncharacterized protein
MNLRSTLMICAFTWVLCSCNISVTSFPPSASPSQGEKATEAATEIPPTPFPDTPAPPTIPASVIEAPAFTDIQFFNELDGWGITEMYLVRTNDGGITWYDVTPTDLDEVGSTVETFILDKDHAWVQKPDFNNFPNNGILYHTADGGLTWSISSTPFSGGDLSFLDEDNGWMLGDLGVGAGSNAVAVFQTTDGGATWTERYSNDPNNPEAGDSLPLGGLKSDLAPIDMQTAWIGGVIYAPGTVYLYCTDDRGRTWTLVNLPLPEGAENVELGIDRDQMQFVSAQDGFLVVRMSGDSTQTAVYVTNDGGDRWTLTPTLIPEAGDSDFLSAEEAIIYNGEQFYITRDRARSWTTVSPDIVFGDSFLTMDFVNPNSGWIVSAAEEQYSLYRTHDGGATWLPVTP